MVRGYLALAIIGITFLAADALQRTVILLLIRLWPASRERVLTVWARGLSRAGLGILRLSGATLPRPARIPADPGVLVVMNHQSLIDIPVAVLSLVQGYPHIVTRRRYRDAWIPVVSHMLRLYEHPIVEPGAARSDHIEALRRKAATTSHPLVIFPEGTRTRNGEIGSFKKGGLRVILAARPWFVYLVVNDGFWHCARLADFARSVSSVRGQLRCVGPIEAPTDPGTFDEFVDELHERMCGLLKEMRDRNS